jgi:glutamate dehydrogenase (NADP+)
MKNIYDAASSPHRNMAAPATWVAGANIAGFLKVADAMLWQGFAY